MGDQQDLLSSRDEEEEEEESDRVSSCGRDMQTVHRKSKTTE